MSFKYKSIPQKRPRRKARWVIDLTEEIELVSEVQGIEDGFKSLKRLNRVFSNGAEMNREKLMTIIEDKV